ncbi:aldo/keto reductase [Haladaptatus cibarius]|uniref:aldo/keto reductase n=1 Tax=Haladaptatus cibarius TaxID=453847 RepID=UPI000A0465DE|nr:aldo/keto reductase [Haladaptatus cibarius]
MTDKKRLVRDLSFAVVRHFVFTSSYPLTRIEYETIQDTDIPKIGLGTWRMGGSTCRNAVETALDLGYRHIDTAQAYGNERQVGQAIENAEVAREDIFLTTKVWPIHRKYDAILDSVHESLAQLGTEYVDLLLIHWPNPVASTREVMRGLSAAQNDGLTRHIGVSNFDVEQLESARNEATAPILTDQVQFHPYNPQRELLDYCQENDVTLTVYSPLAHGGAMHDQLLTRWLPLVLRVLIVLLVALPAAGKFLDYAGQVEFFTSLGIPAPQLMVLVVGTIEATSAVMLLLGIAGRVAALALVSIMLVAIVTAGANPLNLTILLASIGILSRNRPVLALGTGKPTSETRRIGCPTDLPLIISSVSQPLHNPRPDPEGVFQPKSHRLLSEVLF